MEIFRTIIDTLRDLESRAGDFLLNIESRGAVYFDRSGERKNFSDYETTSHVAVLAAIRAAGLSDGDIVYVIGSGKGRAMAHLARVKLRKVVGIELSEELYRISRNNMEKLRGRKTPVEIRNKNVVDADLSEATVFYMFNPFGPETMKIFLGKIDSCAPGTMIIYLNPLCRSVFDEFPRFRIAKDVKFPTGIEILIYEAK